MKNFNKGSGLKATYFCELCGAPVARPRYYLVEGVKMILCDKCARYGIPVREPAFSTPRNRHVRSRRRIVQRPRKEMPWEGESDDLVPDYGRRIKEARERLGLSQEELARRLGESARFIRKLESQKILPPDDLVRKLEKVLGISLRRRSIEPLFPVDEGHQDEIPDLLLGDILVIRRPKKRKSSRH